MSRRGRRRRKIKYLRVGIALLVVVGCILVVVLLTGFGNKDKVAVNGVFSKAEEIFSDNENSSEEWKKYIEIMNKPEKYPKKLIELLEKNMETVDFVYNYPMKKNSEPAASVGDVSEGEIPKLFQWDEHWGYAEYGEDIIAISGCGPTALSMVIVGLTGDDRITPYKVAKYAEVKGYYVEGTGTAWSLMTEGSMNFGVQGNELPLDESVIFSELAEGNPIICSMGPGDFTDVGHFIVLTGVKDGKIQVNDPNSKTRSRLWEYETLEGQVRNLWVFEKCQKGKSVEENRLR